VLQGCRSGIGVQVAESRLGLIAEVVNRRSQFQKRGSVEVADMLAGEAAFML
jgi:hypothetical protein